MQVRNRTQIFIAAAPEFVFDYLAEPLNQPDWISEAASVDISEDEPVEIGTRFKQTLVITRHGPLETELEVTDLIENELFEVSQIDGPYPVKMRYMIGAVGRGAMVVAIEDSSPPGIYYLLMRPLVKWAVKRRLSGDLNNLKLCVEEIAASETPEPAP